MDTTALLLAVCLGASSSRWQNDINLWIVAAPTANRFIDFLAVFFKKSEPDIAGEREKGVPLHGGPPFPRLVDEALGARALYLDALRGLLDGSSLHPHLQHSVLKAGVDLALVGALRQRHAPSERTVTALPDVVVTTLLFLIDLVLTGDGQDPVLQGDIHILLLEPRKLGTDHQIPILGEHVHGRCPLGELLASLAPPSAKSAKHLVEEAIDLTLRIVKPTEWTQHNPYTSFSLCGPSNWDLPPSAAALYTPSIQFSNTFLVKFTDFFLSIHSNDRILAQFIVCSHW